MFENNSNHFIREPGGRLNSENSKNFLEADLEQDEIKTALLKRPRFSVKARLIIIFMTFFLLIAVTSISAMYMISRINIRLQYVIITEKFSNEIHEIRRAEKNYSHLDNISPWFPI